MPNYSERKGLKTVRETLQIDSLDAETRVALWNWFQLVHWDRVHYFRNEDESGRASLLWSYWCFHFKRPYDEMPDTTPPLVREIKEVVLKGTYNEVYDIIEFAANKFTFNQNPVYANEQNEKFRNGCNNLFRRYMVGVRFVGDSIVDIDSEEQVQAIELALDLSKGMYHGVHTHLSRALTLLADRDSPDYRNSIKESISAVESIACIIANKPKAELGEALKEIEKTHALHGALKSSFSSLYGYTSDASGIRHKLLDESSLDQSDAKFMLVSCSAFVSYLIAKVEA